MPRKPHSDGHSHACKDFERAYSTRGKYITEGATWTCYPCVVRFLELPLRVPFQ